MAKCQSDKKFQVALDRYYTIGDTKRKPRPPPPTGPGTELSRLFRCFGITCKTGCNCDKHLREMNRRGPDWCETHPDIILGWLREEADKRSLPFTQKGAGILLRRAIYLARRNASRAAKTAHRSGNKSNLLESTAIGEPTWTKGTHPTVERIPFTSEPVRNLIYHVYPLSGSDVWRWNVDMILERIGLFNGRRIVAIAVGDETESAEIVKDRFGSEVVEYMVFKNNKHAGEMSSFVPLLAQVESDDPNQVTFRAHSKGVMRCQKEKSPHLRDWVEMLYRANLEDWPLVRDHLESAAMTGSCRKFDQFNKRLKTNKPTYSGSFYWFRNCFVFSRDWQVVDTPRWGCESWPAKMFTKEETRCICLDNTGSMYSAVYWESTVKPAYETWLKERGLSR